MIPPQLPVKIICLSPNHVAPSPVMQASCRTESASVWTAPHRARRPGRRGASGKMFVGWHFRADLRSGLDVRTMHSFNETVTSIRCGIEVISPDL